MPYNEKKDYRELSKRSWSSEIETLEGINAGSLQRIADATELMASNYTRIQSDLEYYKKRYEVERSANRKNANIIRGLKSYIKRIKK